MLLDNFGTWQAWFWRDLIGGAVRELGGAALQWARAHPGRVGLAAAAIVAAVYIVTRLLGLIFWAVGRLWLLAALAVGAGALLLVAGRI